MISLPVYGPKVLRFRVAGVPATKGSHRVVSRARSGRPLPRPVLLNDSPRTKVWEDMVAWAARAAMASAPPLDEPLALQLVFALPRPPSVRRECPAVKPDIDKLARTICDALTGIVWDDDGRVVLLTASKRYSDEPGVVVVVERVKRLVVDDGGT